MTESILDAFKQDSWRLGDCQVIPYDRKRIDVFGTNYLHYLYAQCLESRPSSPYGILDSLFCGFADLSADAVCSYLANKQVILLCIHDSPTQFTPAGFAWPVEHIKSPAANSAFCAFAYFRPYWGTPESVVLGMLGLSYLFSHYSLRTVLGQRYISNVLAGRFLAQFGAKDCGTVPDLLRTHTGTLEPCTVSALTREDFEAYTRKALLRLAGETVSNGQGQHGPSRSDDPSG
jgi:hypothetical protein